MKHSIPVVVLVAVFRAAVCLFPFASGTLVFSQQDAATTTESLAGSPRENGNGFVTAVHNPWSRFPVGSWIQKRTTTTIFEGGGVAQSTSDSTVRLEAIEPDGILLNESVTVDMGPRIVGGEPLRKKFDFLQQPVGQDILVVDLPNEKLDVDGRLIDCKVRSYEQIAPQSKKKTKLWYHGTLAPHVLCRETVRTAMPGPEHSQGAILSYSRSHVLSPPIHTLRGRFFGSYRVKAFRRNTEGTSVTVSNHSLRIPGGLRNEWTYEYNHNNQLVRKTETFVLRYSIARPGLAESPSVELVDPT